MLLDKTRLYAPLKRKVSEEKGAEKRIKKETCHTFVREKAERKHFSPMSICFLDGLLARFLPESKFNSNSMLLLSILLNSPFYLPEACSVCGNNKGECYDEIPKCMQFYQFRNNDSDNWI